MVVIYSFLKLLRGQLPLLAPSKLRLCIKVCWQKHPLGGRGINREIRLFYDSTALPIVQLTNYFRLIDEYALRKMNNVKADLKMQVYKQ